MNTTLKNILANYGNRLWSIAAIYLFTPIYIDLLGLEAFAIIAFYTLLFSIVTFADAGIATAMDREFAKGGSLEYKLKLIKKFEKLYLLIFSIVAVSIFLWANTISTHWLAVERTSNEDLAAYVRIMGFAVSAQLMSSIYMGGLMGLQKQVQVNTIQVFWNIFRTTIPLVSLYFNKDLNIFFGILLIINVMFIFLNRYALMTSIRVVSSSRGAGADNIIPVELWKYIGGMFLITLLTAASSQIDKIFVSNYFNLTFYGFYHAVSLFGQIPLMVSISIVLAIFPIMTKRIAERDEYSLKKVVHKYSFILNSLVMSICCSMIFCGKDVFVLWIKGKYSNPILTGGLGVLILILSLSSLLISIQQVPYYFLLASGRTKFTIFQTAIQLAFLIPALHFSITYYGLVGAMLPLFVSNFFGYCYLLYVLNKNYSYLDIMGLIRNSMMIPLLTNTVVFILVFSITREHFNDVEKFILVFVSALISFGLTIVLFNRVNPGNQIRFRGLKLRSVS